ncbi:MAG: hypothetical protein R2867_06550 [Caldilineaceae bacterium]
MSKARAQARRRQKQGQRTVPILWIWGIVIVLPLLLIVGVYYLFLNREGTAATATGSLPSATLAEEIETAVATLEATAAANFLAEPPDQQALPSGPADYCRRHPRFARQLGFNERSILTTSAPSVKGLVLIQPAEGNEPEQVYQDPTWDDAGYLGHMTFDPVGNVYVFPAPRVSLIDNPPEQQNTLFRVDTDSAVLTPFITLTAESPISAANPYGLMGTTYDCDTNSLYAATVAGSTSDVENGKVVRIDLETESVVAELQGIDPFGLTILNEAESTMADSTAALIEKRLYFGAARSGEVYSIVLNAVGDFVGQPELELALPDPSLKPWRIVWDTNGDMVVRAMPFDYNLIATSERIEVPFRFRQDAAGLWQSVAE